MYSECCSVNEDFHNLIFFLSRILPFLISIKSAFGLDQIFLCALYIKEKTQKYAQGASMMRIIEQYYE
jgi:hypothetical protein